MLVLTSCFPRKMKTLLSACVACISLLNKIPHTRQEGYKICRSIENKKTRADNSNLNIDLSWIITLDSHTWCPLLPQQEAPCSGCLYKKETEQCSPGPSVTGWTDHRLQSGQAWIWISLFLFIDSVPLGKLFNLPVIQSSFPAVQWK